VLTFRGHGAPAPALQHGLPVCCGQYLDVVFVTPALTTAGDTQAGRSGPGSELRRAALLFDVLLDGGQRRAFARICGAINALTRSLPVEVAPIRVNAVAPSAVRPLLWQEMSGAVREQMYEQFGAGLPAGGVEVVAGVNLYCLAPP
jgi:NAD(P)-dependent dehydrogenase (short-subunit alcohol dehydrogenase family)